MELSVASNRVCSQILMLKKQFKSDIKNFGTNFDNMIFIHHNRY